MEDCHRHMKSNGINNKDDKRMNTKLEHDHMILISTQNNNNNDNKRMNIKLATSTTRNANTSAPDYDSNEL